MRKLLDTNERFQNQAKEAKRICVSLGPCGNRQLATELVKTLHENLAQYTHAPTTFLYTKGATELDPTLFPEIRIATHQPHTSSTTPIANFDGDFSPQVNSEFLSADLRIIIGELKPHPFLQYSGLCDIVFPGLASAQSEESHLARRTSFSMSNLHKERLMIAGLVSDVFALGWVLGAEGTPLHLAFGSLPESLSTLENAIQTVCGKDVAKPADIVVISAGGVPQDETLLQVIETFPLGISALKRNGILIVAAECCKGHGDAEFYAWSAERKEARYLEARLRHRFNYNGYQAAYLRRIVDTHKVYLSSTIPDHYVEHIFGMKAAATANAALQSAQRTIGSNASVSVIPDAGRVFFRQPPSIPQQPTNLPQ
jgi:nickel-dependent lactate racemase